MRHDERDEDYGLTPREWLDSDPVPLTSDVDLNDPEQRLAWIRAGSSPVKDRRSTTVVAVRIQNPEHRALVRLARREGVTVSDLMRRWARAGLDVANGTAPVDAAPYPEPAATDDERAVDKDAVRRALADAADAAVQRITDDLRRLREIVVTTG